MERTATPASPEKSRAGGKCDTARSVREACYDAQATSIAQSVRE